MSHTKLRIVEKPRYEGAYFIEATGAQELTKEQAKEVVHQNACHDDLVAVCEEIKEYAAKKENDSQFLLQLIEETAKAALAKVKVKK